MAFIRRHRMVLVPLFAVMLVGAAALLLLRGQSDEPGGWAGGGGNVTPAEPRVTAQEWQEDVAKRTQHGREHRLVTTVEYTDPATSETVTERFTSTVRERGTNICYRDAAGDWVPSVAEWVETATGFKMGTNSWKIEVPATLGSAYSYAVGGKTLAMRPSYVLLSDGEHTVSLGTLDTTVTGEIDESDPSKLVFSDVLGVNSGVDIELIVECASLHQNVILRSKPSLPVNFSEETTRLYVYTELGLDAFTADPNVGVKLGETDVNTGAVNLLTVRNESDPIAFTLTETVNGEQTERVLHSFVQSRVWDGTGPANEACAARQLWRNPADSRTYLVESIDFAWVDDATGAITIDYENRSGTMTESETWTADATYYVSERVFLDDDVVLTIEPGTVIKLDHGTWIRASGTDSKVIAQGEPYDYIVFTSVNDDYAGVVIDSSTGSPDEGDYGAALVIDEVASSDCVIQYCKIAYAEYEAVYVDSNVIQPISHCIIHDCALGLQMPGPPWPDVFNNLIYDCSDKAVNMWGPKADSETVTELYNNTIDGCDYGIRARARDEGTGSYYPEFDIYNNLITNNNHGIYKYDAYGTFDLDNNGYYGNTTDVNGVGGITESNAIDLDVSPYDPNDQNSGYHPSALGRFFIDPTDVGGTDGSDLVDGGTDTFDSIYGSGAQLDVEAPELIDSDITGSPTTWEKRSCDTGTVDVGYHHPRVDKVIDDTDIEIANNAALTIDPGVVVAFCDDDARLSFDDSATGTVALACDGTPDDFIILVGKPLVSMQVEAQYVSSAWWEYPHKGILLDDPSATETVSISYTRIIGMCRGIEIAYDMDTGIDVKHCVFERGLAPLYVDGGSDRAVTVANCLFHDNLRGAIYDLNSTSSTTLALCNCTFDGHDVALVVKEGTTGASAIVKDCLFTNSNWGVCVNDSDALDCLTEQYNAYWACGPANSAPIWRDYEPDGAEMPDATSIMLTASPYDADWTAGEWADQWYLDDTGECADAGSDYSDAVEVDLSTFTTSLEGGADVGKVDIGYHYGGFAGVDSAHLEVSSSPVVNAFFTTSTTLQIYVEFGTGGGNWKIWVDQEGTERSSGMGDIGGETLSLSGLSTGWHTIRIEYDAGDTDDIVFRVYIDDDSPTTLTIIWPDDDSTVPGY